jgi:hypothetical protein
MLVGASEDYGHRTWMSLGQYGLHMRLVAVIHTSKLDALMRDTKIVTYV